MNNCEKRNEPHNLLFRNAALDVITSEHNCFKSHCKVDVKSLEKRAMFIVVASVFLVALAIYLHLTWYFDYWRKKGVAGPVPRAYLGTFPKTASLDKNSNFIEETTEIYRKYYKKHRYVGVFQFRQPKLLILDPTLVTDIYVKYFKNFGDNTFSDLICGKTDPLFKPNPFIEKLAQWKERRLELASIYTMLKVKGMYPAIENACRHLEQFINNKIESRQNVLYSKDICARVVADIICNLVFGLEANAYDESSEFLEQSLGMFYSSSHEVIRSAAYTIFPWLRKIYPERFVTSEFTNWFKSLLDQAIQLRKENNVSRDDYLNFLIELREKKNTPMDMIYAHAYTYFLDGFETTTYALGCVLNNLARNKHCQEKLRAEINNYGRHITFDELHKMPYLDAVVNETTRLSPFPFPIWKNCTEEILLTDFNGKSLLVEKGVKIIIPVNALHTHPDFYTDPKKFDPERFDESKGGAKRLKDAGVYMPFGNGPRSCLGMRYALTKIKSVLCTLIRNFEFSIENKDDASSAPVGMLFFSENSALLNVKRI